MPSFRKGKLVICAKSAPGGVDSNDGASGVENGDVRGEGIERSLEQVCGWCWLVGEASDCRHGFPQEIERTFRKRSIPILTAIRTTDALRESVLSRYTHPE